MCYADEAMINFVYSNSFADFDKFILSDMPLDNLLDLWANRCTKGGSLLDLMHHSSNLLDITNKSHIQHSIYFIKNEITYFVNIYNFLIDKIQQSTWRRYDDTWMFGEKFFLHHLACSAIDASSIYSIIFCQCKNFFANLIDQFPCRSENQCL